MHRLYSKSDSRAIADVITMHGETIDNNKPYTIFDPEHTWKKKTVTDFYSRELLKPIFERVSACMNVPTLMYFANIVKWRLTDFGTRLRDLKILILTTLICRRNCGI